jgi:SAM-dependent methyltransferase
MDAPEDATSPNNPLERHRVKTEQALRSQDEAAIKGLYVELGQDFWEVAGSGDSSAVPVLSAPETLSAVVDGLSGTTGLVLDAGCGPNPAVAIELGGSSSRSVLVLDIGWGMVRTAMTLAAEKGVTLLGVAGDVEQLPFRDGAFDGLVCDDTIEHLPNDRAGVSELSRVLKPTGLALLATPNRHSALVLRARLKDRLAGVRKTPQEYFVASSHLREYTWSQFERLVNHCFVIDLRRPVGWYTGPKKRMLSRLLWLPVMRGFSQVIVLQCRPRKSQA